MHYMNSAVNRHADVCASHGRFISKWAGHLGIEPGLLLPINAAESRVDVENASKEAARQSETSGAWPRLEPQVAAEI